MPAKAGNPFSFVKIKSISQMIEKRHTIFYFYNINKIGGIETFFYQLAKKYNDYDITIYYKVGDAEQIKRLSRYIRVVQFKNQTIRCEKAFFNFNLDIIDNVEANEYVQILHGDYKAMKIAPNTHKKINKYIGVSQVACDSFKEMTGKEAHVVYNPIQVDAPKKVLNLVSATRLTKEKGKSRIEKLAKILDDHKIPYIWLIFTNDVKAINNPNVIYMKPRLDIQNYISNADYLVQLSDNEGYCYSVIESLLLGTPVIVTDMPVMKELGVENNKNGFIVDFELTNVDVHKIYKADLKFTYEAKEDDWHKHFEKGKSNYKQEIEKSYMVEALDTYKKGNIVDAELGEIPEPGRIWEVSEERLQVLLGKNKSKLKFVKKIEDITPCKV
jgi:glycosyltransferase involved in cell wall biosynthesis